MPTPTKSKKRFFGLFSAPTATDIVEGDKNKSVKIGTDARSSVETVTSYIAALHEQPDLNAFNFVDEQGALNRARELDGDMQTELPLRGVVIAVKDNVHVAYMPNTAGTPALSGFTPTRSASLVTSLENAGAIILGKAGMHELAYGATNNNFAFGPVLNPIDITKTPGGSSGGSAAAVAGGLVQVAIGTDTGGSVRIPAALTGTVGFRPSVGRYSQDGVTMISPTRDTIGFISRTVEEIILLDGIVCKDQNTVKAVNLSDLRIGVPRAHFYDGLDPEVAEIAESFIRFLRSKGVTLVEADLKDVPELNEQVGFPLVLYETSITLPKYLKDNKIGITSAEILDSVSSPDVEELLTTSLRGDITEDMYSSALNVSRPKLQEAYADYFALHKVDAVLFPTTPITARDIDGILDGVNVNGDLKNAFATYIQNTDPASNAGLPGISIPAGRSPDGLPVGMELDGPAGSDQRILAIALAIQTATLDTPINDPTRGGAG